MGRGSAAEAVSNRPAEADPKPLTRADGRTKPGPSRTERGDARKAGCFAAMTNRVKPQRAASSFGIACGR